MPKYKLNHNIDEQTCLSHYLVHTHRFSSHSIESGLYCITLCILYYIRRKGWKLGAGRKRSTFSAKITRRWLRWIYVLYYLKIKKIRPTATTNRHSYVNHNKLYKSCDMFEDKCVWSALYPISNHSHIRQLQFATHAFSQQVL